MQVQSYLQGQILISKSIYDFNWYLDGETQLASYVNHNRRRKTPVINVTISVQDDGSLLLENFTSLLGMNKLSLQLASSEEKEMLKGLPYSSLCFLIGFIITREQIKDPLIMLEATPLGDIDRDSMRLIRFYKKIGFTTDLSDEIISSYLDAGRAVIMVGDYNKITNTCKENAIKKIALDSVEIIE